MFIIKLILVLGPLMIWQVTNQDIFPSFGLDLASSCVSNVVLLSINTSRNSQGCQPFNPTVLRKFSPDDDNFSQWCLFSLHLCMHFLSGLQYFIKCMFGVAVAPSSVNFASLFYLPSLGHHLQLYQAHWQWTEKKKSLLHILYCFLSTVDVVLYFHGTKEAVSSVTLDVSLVHLI